MPSIVLPLVQFADRVRAIVDTGLDGLAVGDRAPTPALVEELKSFDRIVSWYGANRPEFVDALREIAPQAKFLRALPGPENARHATDFFAEQVGAPCGLRPQLIVPATAPRNTIVIHPFSGSARKNWPLANFRALAQSLPFPVEWSAGPEEPLREAVRFENLLDLAAWLRGARLYVGNDSGITHLAAAAEMPVVALFGPSNPAIWAPRGPNVTVIAKPSSSAPRPDLEASRLLREILRRLV